MASLPDEPTQPWDLPMKTADAGDFLGLTPDPSFRPPKLKDIGMPSPIPADEDLYAVQNNLLRSIQALDALAQDNPDLHWTGLQHHLRNSYKTLNRWLREHT